VRDWGFVGSHYFCYKPSYAKSLYSQAAVGLARRGLNQRLRCRPRHTPLILDGGNLVHNGRIAILTEKVLRDNSHATKHAIEQAIVSVGFEKVVFIPSEPNDNVGHADGIVRFLSDDILLVNDYVGDEHFGTYRHSLLKTLAAARLPSTIVPFPWMPSQERFDGVWSAVGVYINFVTTANGVIFPTFRHALDDRAEALLRSLAHVPVKAVESSNLARFGGSLNCVTLHGRT
jgi:agmatine deiminase